MTTPPIAADGLPAAKPSATRWKALATCGLVVALVIAAAVLYIQLRKDRAHWTLWQLPPVGQGQAMSYVIQTQAGHLIVIDGGWESDGPFLGEFIRTHGGAVTAWFITHPHPDHEGALTAILRSPSPPHIDTVYASLPTEDFVKKHEPQYTLDFLKLESALEAAHLSPHEVSPGDVLMIDGLKIEILGAKNPELQTNAINNSSVVFRVTGRKSILFTGDLGLEGGQKILDGPYRTLLHANYVQMAHHGQAGVGKSFYEAVNPDCCLWPTPAWLWNNDTGAGHNSGTWKTYETRKWIEEMNIKRNIISKDGPAEIRE